MSVDDDTDALVDELRAAGCVFAEEEAAILRDRASGAEELARWVGRRIAGEPLEHVVGVVKFAGVELAVGPGVFIPRQRTRLVAAVAGEAVARYRPGAVFVEPYCGVAPIAAVVARDYPGAVVVATDVDPVALDYARRNLGLAATVCRGIGLAGVPAELRGRVSAIAAVPPYVPVDELDLMPAEARDHEPLRTHSGGAGGLDEVGYLIAEAVTWLEPGGTLLIELHRDQADTAAEIAVDHGCSITVVTEHAAYPDDGHTAVAVLGR
ncbi:SAM-dependent methyltransferase [Gordonia crocea]|uniref:Methylase of HemK family protein n=1 Tax=Gordonia crocea TaxID=589162 RepID=A0A7I9UWY4_9ACTN|nr:SAM-dependent methyltransferase [Gordonia crocea]GED97714.1 methylase of HemK family protein [Gordonia crocea]